MSAEHLRYFAGAATNLFDATVLKGVAQGLGCQSGNFTPTFVVHFAGSVANFLRQSLPLFHSDVLCFCQTLRNPWHPATRLEGGVRLNLAVSDQDNLASLEMSRKNNMRGCMFEQQYHSLPLVSDREEDVLRWDRDADLLMMALAETAITSVVPTISEVPPEEILTAREKLADLLPPFRLALTKAAWEIATAARGSSRKEVIDLGQLYFRTRIQPAVDEIESKLKSEDKKLKRKLLERGIDKTVLVAKALDPTEPLSKWDLVGSSLKSVLDVDASLQERAHIKSPYEFLVRVPRALRHTAADRTNSRAEG